MMSRRSALRQVLCIPIAAMLCLLLLGWVTAPTYGQSANGEIGGTVSDATGAVVPDAVVVATNTATGVDYPATTNGSGVYFIPEILPGPYKISVTKQGFAPLVKSGLHLRTGDRLTLNLSLSVATGSQSVTVQEEFVPLMMSADQTSSATVLDNKMITELPQLNRNSLDLTAVTPSVQGAGPLSNQIGTLGNAGYLIANNGNSYSVAGGQVNGTTISVDGTLLQDQEFNAVNRSIPTPDTIGEFRVESGVLTADHGRYSGGIITMNTQSGTSAFHGRLFEYFRNQNLNANDWADNAGGVPLPKFHQNNYGLSVGGPVWIPKVYTSKNRTFFYFGWEGERFSQGATIKSSVPTMANRNGDFSQSVINEQGGNPVYAKIYDPFNGYLDSTGNWVRPEFPGGIIPAAGTCVRVVATGSCYSTQAAVFSHYMNIYPLPNHAPFGVTDHIWNRWDTINTTRPSDRFFLRLDHNLSPNQRIGASISRSRLTNSIPAPFAGSAQSVTTDHDTSGSALYTWVISPRSILDVHLGFGWSKLYSDGVSGYGMAAQSGIDTSTWGFDPLLVNNPEKTTVNIPPGISVGNPNPGGFGYTTIGGSEFDTFINQNINGTASFTRVIGKHTIKTGFELYFMRFNENGGDHTGVAWINPGGGSNQFWNNNDGLTGSPLAEFMMGSSNFFQWGNWNIAPFGWNEAAYVTDDWKVNNKLTVQLGLRWDHDGGRQSRYPKGSLQYDMSAKNVLTPNAGWDWSQVSAAVPQVAGLGLPSWVTNGAQGRVVLLDTPEYPQKNLYSTDWMNFQPRIGIAYSPFKDTVFRASGGIIYQGLGGLSTDWFSFYYNSVTFNQIASLDGGQHYISELGLDHGLGTFPLQTNGLPLGYYPPVTTNAAYGYQTFGAAANLDQAGTTIGHFNSPEEYMWELSVQRQISPNWVFTAGYTGIRGIHLLMPVWNWSTNNIPLKYYSLGTHLFDQVPNPFYGQSQTFASQPTVPLYQLLGGAPQYSQVSPGQATWGKSMSNFLTLQMQSRNWHGLTLLAAYSIRKTLTNTAGKDIQHNGPAGRGLLQDPHNLMEAYGVALYELPQTLLLNYSYDLPFGHGRKFLSSRSGWSQRVTDFTVGGWALAGVTTWYPKGTPVLMPDVSGGQTAPGAAIRWSLNPGASVYNSGYSYSNALIGIDGNLPSGGKGVLNGAAFSRTPDFSLSNAAFVFPNVRNPGAFYTDATILKKFYFSKYESLNLEFRAEALNIFNHPNYGLIDNNPDSSTFGGVQGKSGNRIMQLGLRLFF